MSLGPGPRHSYVPGQRRRAHFVRRIPGRGAMTAAQQPATAAQQPSPPEGYLGTTARITSGPAPELVEAGYALEIADAPLLHRGLTLADLAHLVELVECGALTPRDRIGGALGRVELSPAGAGGAGGTRLPMDRTRPAGLLAFGSVGAHPRDAMWSADVQADAVAAAAQAVATIGQLAGDLEIF